MVLISHVAIIIITKFVKSGADKLHAEGARPFLVEGHRGPTGLSRYNTPPLISLWSPFVYAWAQSSQPSIASVMELRRSLLAETPAFYPPIRASQTQLSVRPNTADRGELRIKFESLARLLRASLIRPSSRVAHLSLSAAILPLVRIREVRGNESIRVSLVIPAAGRDRSVR